MAGAGRTRAPSADQLLLAALVLGSLALVAATPALIVPYPARVPWYESSALFPRLTLVLAICGGLAELWLRWRGLEQEVAGSEELDSSSADIRHAVAAVALFAAYTLATPWLGYASCTVLYLLATGRLLGLRWREALMLALPLTAVLWLVFVQVLKVAFGHGLLP